MARALRGTQNGDGFLTLEELLVCLANVACGRPMKEAHTGEQKPLPSEMDAKARRPVLCQLRGHAHVDDVRPTHARPAP